MAKATTRKVTKLKKDAERAAVIEHLNAVKKEITAVSERLTKLLQAQEALAQKLFALCG